MKNLYFLRIDNDYLEDAKAFKTKQGAIACYTETAQELYRYGQSCSATIHLAPSKDEVDEYPDFILTIGPRGGVQITHA